MSLDMRRIALAPLRHVRTQIGLDVLGELLEHDARRPAASGARADQRRERAQAHRLQDFLGDNDFARPVAIRLRGERDADRVADTLLQQHRERRRGRDDPFRAHARFGEPEVQRIVAPPRELGVDGNQVLHVGHLAREDDAVARHADRFGELRAANRRRDERLANDVRRTLRPRGFGVFVHQARQQVLVKAAPVDADAYRLPMLDCTLDHHGELRIAPGAGADVAGVDPVLRERARTVGEIAEQLVAAVVEIADQRHVTVECVERFANGRHGGSRFSGVHGDPDELRARIRERLDLRNGRRHVRRVRIGHRLDDDRCAAADRDAADEHLPRGTARHGHRFARRNCPVSHAGACQCGRDSLPGNRLSTADAYQRAFGLRGRFYHRAPASPARE